MSFYSLIIVLFIGYPQQWMTKNNVCWFKSPPESPDMNPIEVSCHYLFQILTDIMKNKYSLISGCSWF